MIRVLAISAANKIGAIFCGATSGSALIGSLLLAVTDSDSHWDALVKLTYGCLIALSSAVVTLFTLYLGQARRSNRIEARMARAIEFMRAECPCLKSFPNEEEEDED